MPSDVSEQKRDFSRWAPWYIGAITLLGIAILLVALTRLPAHRLGLLLFAGMAAIAELGSVELFINSRHSHVSVSSMIALATTYSLRLYAANMKVVVNQLEEMNRTLYETNLGLLETLGAVIDADDLYTYGHSAQVSVYAGAIAEKMGLSSRAQSLVIQAALVHDVGKVGVMDSLISKPGPLTVDEYHIVKRHPVIGPIIPPGISAR